jgi:hypothetical protein
VRLRVTAVALIAAASLTAMSVDASASTLSKSRAQKAAFGLVKRLGRQKGAALWYAGLCKRKSASRVDCWGALMDSDYNGAAQRIKVTRSGGQVRASRYGKIYYGSLADEAPQHSSGGEWAICGIHQSVCIGS